MKRSSRVVDPQDLQGSQVLDGKPSAPVPIQQGVPCRKCGCTLWSWYQTTCIQVDTEANTAKPSEIITREMRCSKCGIKADARQVKELAASPGFISAVKYRIISIPTTEDCVDQAAGVSMP